MSKKSRSDNSNLELNLGADSENHSATQDLSSPPPGAEDPSNHLDTYYSQWFLEYASYVILEKAVPHALDGLKPVQRRILHSLKELDDGRYNKVANVIGNTMKYHPHGDASIGDAMVQICKRNSCSIPKETGAIPLLVIQHAPRYIEVRLSKFALEVAFNTKTTHWLSSYDGRSKEPEILPLQSSPTSCSRS